MVAQGDKLGIYPLLKLLKRVKNICARKKEIYQLLITTIKSIFLN
jgi:hypothetical protein